jgi:hypothetical protein
MINRGIAIAIGLIGLAITTMPYGLIILVGMAWVWSKG